MSAEKLSDLEQTILRAILSDLIFDNSRIDSAMAGLVAIKREYTPDSLDAAQCCGFYVDFEMNDILRGVPDVPTHVGVQAKHPLLPVGADFVLFFDESRGGIKYLEASFFGDSLSKNDLELRASEFQFGSPLKQ